MYPTLNALLDWKDGLPPRGASVLVTDSLEPTGDFLLHHFISGAVRASQPLVVVGLANTLSHFNAISRKLGINLNSSLERGEFAFVDGITSLTALSSDSSPNVTGPRIIAVDAEGEDEATVAKMMYHVVEEQVLKLYDEQQPKSNPGDSRGVCLVIDDVTVLVSAGAPAEAVVMFVKACAGLMEKMGGNLVMLAHVDKAISLDQDQEYLIKSLMYRLGYILAIQPLVTGYSRDVHGQVSVIRGPRLQKDMVRPRLIHYKILDSGSGVEFFAPGFAHGVL